MRIVLAVFMLLHGFAHLPGFVASWSLAPESIPHKTTLLSGRLDVGEPATQLLGVAWLILAAAFMVVAIGAWGNAPWWRMAGVIVAGLSMAMSAAAWPEAKVGVAANFLVLLGIAYATWGASV